MLSGKVARVVVAVRPLKGRGMIGTAREAVMEVTVRIAAEVERLVRGVTVSQILLEGAILLPIHLARMQSLRFSLAEVLVADVFTS